MFEKSFLIEDENYKKYIIYKPIAKKIAKEKSKIDLYKKQWDKDDLLSDFYDVKCDLEVLLSSMVESDRIKFVEGDNDILHPGQRMNVYIDDVKIGYFGQLHPNICSNFEFIKNVYAYDLSLK